jgi:hypothetical protein
MVHAAEVVTLKAPHRERGEAMAASVLKRDRGTVAGAVNNDGLVQDADGRERFGGEVTAPSGGIPAIAKEHENLLGSRPRVILLGDLAQILTMVKFLTLPNLRFSATKS